MTRQARVRRWVSHREGSFGLPFGMSVVSRLSSGHVYAGLRMTADQYLALGETFERYELIDGIVVMSPSPTPLHQRVIFEILFQLGLHARETGKVEVFQDTDVRLDSDLIYRPDISVYRAERITGIPDRLTAAPDLVVEVLSRRTRALDLATKRDDYGRFGVREYWVVMPKTAGVRCWRRGEAGFEEAAVAGETLPSSALTGFVLELGPLRRIAGVAG